MSKNIGKQLMNRKVLRVISSYFVKNYKKNIDHKAVQLILFLSAVEKKRLEDFLEIIAPALDMIVANKLVISEEDVLVAYHSLSKMEVPSRINNCSKNNSRERGLAKVPLRRVKKEKKLSDLLDYLLDSGSVKGSPAREDVNVELEEVKEETRAGSLEDVHVNNGEKSSKDKVASVSEGVSDYVIKKNRRDFQSEMETGVSARPHVSLSETRTKLRSISVKLIHSPKRISFSESYEIFQQLFLDRYRRIGKILRERGFSNIVSSNDLGNAGERHIILLVYEKRLVKNGKAGMIVGEDEYGFVSVYVPLQGELKSKFDRLLLDSVIAVKFTRKSGNFIIAEDIIFPEPPRPKVRNRAPEPLKVAFVSDIHIGSKLFLDKYFENFIKFLNGNVEDPTLRGISKDISAVVIVGDLVDGIGVYPNQQDELRVTDIYKQFDILREYLDKIRSDIEIIAIPGNHDPAGKFIPQPPIPDEFLGELLDKSNFHMFGNPALISIEGVNILLYHGQGLEDIASDLNISIKKPTIMMVEEIRHRHILPMWGKEPIIPLEYDPLVIDNIPDIYVTGHLHMVDARITKISGTLLINSSTFQGLTSWQKKLGIKPTPGIVPIVDLHSYDVHFVKCDDVSCSLLNGSK